MIAAQKGKRMVRWVLVGSVALNLFLAGVVIGPLLRHRPMMGPPPLPEMIMDHLTRTMPSGDSGQVRAIFAEEREVAHEREKKLHALFRDLGLLLRQDKPDLKEIEDKLTAIHAAAQASQDSMGKAIMRLAAEVSPESRRKIVDVIERGPGGPRPDGPGADVPPPPFDDQVMPPPMGRP